MPDLSTIPAGTLVRITTKGSAPRTITGTVIGPYTRDIMPAVVIDTADGSDFPQVSVSLHHVASVEILSTPVAGELSETDGFFGHSDACFKDGCQH